MNKPADDFCWIFAGLISSVKEAPAASRQQVESDGDARVVLGTVEQTKQDTKLNSKASVLPVKEAQHIYDSDAVDFIV